MVERARSPKILGDVENLLEAEILSGGRKGIKTGEFPLPQDLFLRVNGLRPIDRRPPLHPGWLASPYTLAG